MNRCRSHPVGERYVGKSASGRIVPGSILEAWIGEGNDPRDLLAIDVGVEKRSGKVCSGVIELSTRSDRIEVFLKKYTIAKFRRIFDATMGNHRATNVWDMSWHLTEHSVPVPRPLGYFVQRMGSDWGTSTFCCELIKDCSNLNAIFLGAEVRSQWLIGEGFLEIFADGVASMHQSGVVHGDLKWTNILVDEPSLHYWLVDLDSCAHLPEVGRDRHAARDLARFVVSGLENGVRRDILKPFLDRYAERQSVTTERLQSVIDPWIQKLLRKKRMCGQV